MANFYSIWTDVGRAKEAAALVGGARIEITHVAVGDGGGATYDPVGAQIALVGEKWRGAPNLLAVDDENPNWVRAEAFLPASVGGWTVREAGLIDAAGDLVAIAKLPETYKPVLAEGSGKDLLVRLILEVTSSATVTLKIDPTAVLASRAFVSAEIEGVEGLVAAEAAARKAADVVLAAALAAHEGDTDNPHEVTAETIDAARIFLCEFYFFRHPTLRPGFQPAQGGLLENAAALYPEAWAYLQTAEGQLLCKTEAEWQAMTQAIWHTNADGSQVGWNGIGGAPFYVQDLAAGTLRLPDIRGMYAEAAGFDSLGVGGVHGDAIRNITGSVQAANNGFGMQGPSGAFNVSESFSVGGHADVPGAFFKMFLINASRRVPVAAKNQPRAWGSLACVYLGRPAS